MDRVTARVNYLSDLACIPEDPKEAERYANNVLYGVLLGERARLLDVDVMCNSAVVEDYDPSTGPIQLFYHYKGDKLIGGSCPEELLIESDYEGDEELNICDENEWEEHELSSEVDSYLDQSKGVILEYAEEGIIGMDVRDEMVLKMKNWRCAYYGNDDYKGQEFPMSRGCILYMREDYVRKMKGIFGEMMWKEEKQ